MKIGILTPVYFAWDKVEMMCNAIDKNTSNEFTHILIADSCTVPDALIADTKSIFRYWLKFDDGEPPEKHRACITKALQTGYDFLSNRGDFDYLFVIESDVMIPIDWDKLLISLSELLPDDWLSLDVLPVDEENNLTYPAIHNNQKQSIIMRGGKDFEILKYGDWNAMLFNPVLIKAMRVGDWRFDEVPSHHDILLSRKFEKLFPVGKFYRTPDVRAIHYPNSSRSMLPEGLNTPSNPK
jgi:hypothetical protein